MSDNLSEPLTWEELADLYDESHSGRPARTLPMDSIFEWAANQTDTFKVDEDEGTIHQILNP